MKKAYLPRLIDNIVSIHLDTFGAVCIEGPKCAENVDLNTAF